MKRKKRRSRTRKPYEVIYTGGMAPKNPPPPPKAVSERPTLPFKITKE